MELSVKHNITNFVYASSSSVYGGSKSTFFSEMENVDHPISPYAASKKSVELMAYTYHHLYGLKTSGLRFFTVYGPVSGLRVLTSYLLHREETEKNRILVELRMPFFYVLCSVNIGP